MLGRMSEILIADDHPLYRDALRRALSQAAPGATRTCPHCRETILESAVICPVCRKHLRFDSRPATERTAAVSSPLRVEGTIEHPVDAEPCEYTIFATITNERGEEIERRVLGVVSQRDILRQFLATQEASPVGEEVAFDTLEIGSLLNRDRPVTATPDLPLAKAATLLATIGEMATATMSGSV